MISKLIVLFSAVAAVGLVVLWPMSHDLPNPCFYREDPSMGKAMLLFHSGTLRVSYWRPGAAIGGKSYDYLRRGFGFRSMDVGGYRAYRIIVPIWLLVAVSTIHPIRAALQGPLLRRRRRRRGLCLKCGYCLVGDVTGICPECGSPRS